jgi:hypothetical protein
LSLWVRSKATALGDTGFTIVQSTQASAKTLAGSDWSQVGSTSFASTNISALTTGAYNDFVLNASGISNISFSAPSKFAARLGFDISGSPTWASAAQTSTRPDGSGQLGTDTTPKLTITVTMLSLIPKPKPTRPRPFAPGIAR